MGTIEKTVEYGAAPEKVWSVVSDLNRFGEWLSMHKSWKGEVPSEITTGTQATAIVSLLNMPNTITWTVGEFAPPHRVEMSGTGMAGVKVSIGLDVEADGDGSKVTITAQFEGQMIVGAIGAAVEKAGRAELDQSLAKLGELVG
ncbi:MAG: type II toxin-antitoxin system Rv0910 family toxin [Jatrophihabitans sp.]|uniref:type II toxin-antitoxin system Rv0910 family toxin n=1 Tax=Jatrophihabitans sp. TaxID=1932789 RepID=UPI003F810164